MDSQLEFVETYSPEERKRIDSEFRRLSAKRLNYLDHAGAALYSEAQIRESFNSLSENLYCNPHTSELTELQVNEVREKVLEFFNTTSDEYDVVFTRGATEGLKIIAETFDFQTTGHFVYLRNVHNSVLGMRAIVKTPNVHVVEVDKFLTLPYAENEPSTVYSLSNSLIAFPAQCNFNGFKYPLEVIQKFHASDVPAEFQRMSKNWFVCLDAANYASTSYLDLKKYRPDFVVMSFYKLFGYPTGLGALLVSKRGQQVLKKVYHGGGTVDFALSNIEVRQLRKNFHERFEDGTLSFLSIVSLLSGFRTIHRLVPKANGLNTMERISFHVFRLGKYLYDQLGQLKYPNGRKMIVFYNQTEFELDDKPLQGGIVTFNVKRVSGEMAGYREIEGLAEMNDIYLRVGCFCNPGACQTNLKLENSNILLASGQSCNGTLDVIGDQPFGFVRISVGYITRKSNVDAFLRVIREYFLGVLTVPRIIPSNLQLVQMRIYPIRDGAPLIISSKWMTADDGKLQLKFDNHWAVVNEFGIVMTEKNCPKIGLIRVFINERNDMLRLIFPDKGHFDLSISPPVVRKTSVASKKIGFEGQNNFPDYGDEVAEWLANVLEMPDMRFITVNPQEKNQIVPVDAYFTKSESVAPPLRLLNLSLLLNYLSTNFGVKSSDPVVEEFIQIYRPHFIVYGGQKLEDGMKFRVNDYSFKVQGRLIRNTLHSANSLTGEKISPMVTRIWSENETQIKFAVNVALLEAPEKNTNTILCSTFTHG